MPSAYYAARDPRLDSLSGHLNVDHYEHHYAFVNDLRDKEIQRLRIRAKARKMPGRKGQKLRKRLGISGDDNQQEDELELKRLLQEKADLERQQIQRAAKRTVKQQQSNSGYYLKRREQKKLEREATYEELRKRRGRGAAEKSIAKRLKREKSRDAKRFGKGMQL